MVTATNYNCTISFPTAAPATLCKPAAVVLPDNTADNLTCQWYMTPMTKRRPYHATLTTDATAVGPDVNRINQCAALFSVTGTSVAPPATGGFLLVKDVQDGGQSLIRLNLSPLGVNECPANGLSCTGLTSSTTP
jgi:hypothetical protein